MNVSMNSSVDVMEMNATKANFWAQTIDDVTTSKGTEGILEQNTTINQTDGGIGEGIADNVEKICSIHSFAVFGVICAFICIFGFVVNTVSCAVLWRDRSQSATSFLIIVLAFVDNSVLVSYGIMLIWPTWSVYLQTGATTLRYYPIFDAFFWPFCSLAQVMTSWFIVAVIFQRYIAICKPYFAKKYSSIRVAKIHSIAIILGVFIFNAPGFLENNVTVEYNNETEQYIYHSVKTSIGLNIVFEVLYKSVLYYLVSFMIPVCLLLWMTVSIIRSFYKVAPQEGLAQNGMVAKEKVKREVTIVLIILSVIFMICQLCNPLRRIFEIALPPELKTCPHFYKFFSNWTGAAVVFNSAINFVIFLLCSKGFRRKLKVFVTCSNESNQIFVVSQTGTSNVTD